MNSVLRPRWNFLRADWKAFADDLDYVFQFIPARSNSYERFAKAVVAAAKRHIPRVYRNQYIPGWNVRCDEFYEEYNSFHRSETAANLLQKLNDQRKQKWEKKLLKPPILPIQAEKLGKC
jgi:pyruvate-formate lyase-activating enzyme